MSTLKEAPAALFDNTALVAYLTDLAAMARDGKLVAVAVAGLMHDGCTLTGWRTVPRRFDLFRLLGGITHLSWRFNREEIEATPDQPIPWSS